jgi:hypothetical protein
MKFSKLPNWGRWGRSGHDSGGNGASSIYAQGKTDRNPGVDSNKQYTETHEEPIRIDVRVAELLDSYIHRMHGEYRGVIRSAFYLNLPVGRMRLDAAVRQLLDMMDCPIRNSA